MNALCDGCDKVTSPVYATDDGSAQMCLSCHMTAAIAIVDRDTGIGLRATEIEDIARVCAEVQHFLVPGGAE